MFKSALPEPEALGGCQKQITDVPTSRASCTGWVEVVFENIFPGEESERHGDISHVLDV